MSATALKTPVPMADTSSTFAPPMPTEPSWKVLPHRPIEKLSGSLWRVVGDLSDMPLKRVMTLVRRSDGRVMVHSPVALDADSMEAIDAWGPVTFIIVPNGYHRIDAPRYCTRYPDAKVFCPRAARARVAERVSVSGCYADVPSDSVVSLESLAGTRDNEGVMVVRDGEEVTVVFNDVLFNMPHAPGTKGWVLRYVTGSSGGPRVTRIARLALIKDKKKLAEHIARLAELPGLVRVIVSHHEMITRDPSGVLRAIAESL